ncbi:ZIP family metal transporter [Halochromatium sp.]
MNLPPAEISPWIEPLKWGSVFVVFLAAMAGGAIPLLSKKDLRPGAGFPLGESFASGIFLALSMLIMLPSAHAQLTKTPGIPPYPWAFLIAAIAFLALLAFEHLLTHIRERVEGSTDAVSLSDRTTELVPILLTVLIGVPSFFLGAALGVSEDAFSIVLILVAVLAHKSTAGFALALKMVQSTLSRPQVFALFLVFALSTPIGIVVGDDVAATLGTSAMLTTKALVLAMAAGVFLYMSTLHDMRHSPLITTCSGFWGFLVLVAGFVITAGVRVLLGIANAHHF